MHVTDTASALRASRLGARKLVADLLTVLWGGSRKQYRPEKHYMRGPGPKWREKHGPPNDGGNLVQIPVILDHKWD